ncbi:MAG: ABC transporter ATP-binding protein [Candidatus Buchananbacteria bacterium]
MLELKNIQSGYEKMQILFGVDMKIKEGEIVAIIGPNGAGKSTVLKSIFNQCDIYGGQISLNNKEITKMPTHKLIGLGVSYVPQGRQIFSDMTVKENLEMGAFIFKDNKKVKEDIKGLFLQFPILKEKQKQRASTLSGGQQQLLAIARALIQNPQLLLLDEPSLGLSPKAMKEIFEIIKKINGDGVSIMIVEQNAKQAVELAHRTYVLENGKVALEGDKSILKNEKIKNIYFGSEL